MHPSPGGSLARALALLAVLAPAIAHAEFEEKGVRVGSVVFAMDDRTNEGISPLPPGSSSLISNPSGWVIGGWLTWRKSDSFAVQLEADVSGKHLRTEMCIGDGQCTETARIAYYYAEVPFVLRLDLLPNATKFFIAFGGEGVLTLGGGETPTGGTFTRYDDLFPINLGVLGGLGLEIPAGPGKIAFDLRYKRWFAPITTDKDMIENDPDPSRKIRASHHVMLTVGYAFP